MATNRLSLARVTVAAVTATALATGCSGASDQTPSASPTGAASATPSAEPAVVTWANGVCTASTNLQTSITQVTATLQIDPSASATALDQTKAEAHERVAAVQQSANALHTAITAVPAQAQDSVAAVQQQLTTTADRARRATDQLTAAAQQLTEAQTTAETTTALAATATALAATSAGVTASVDALRQAANNRDPAIRNAFAAAPACAAPREAAPTAS